MAFSGYQNCFLSRANLRLWWLRQTSLRSAAKLNIISGNGISCGTRARTRSKRCATRSKTKKFGRPSALDVTQKRKIAERYAAGETMAQLAADYEVGEATIFRALQGPFEAAA